MGKKSDVDGRRVLELLLDPELGPGQISEKLGDSPEAVDEARCLAEEIEDAEVDAILAMPIQLGRALLRAAAQAGRHDVLVEAASQGDKEFQREAKRLAHALKLRGVDITLPVKKAEETRAIPETSAPPSAEPPIFLSSLDSSGERAVFWSRALPGRGIELAQIIVSDSRGIIDFLSADLSRKRFRELMDDLPKKGDMTIREYDRDEAKVVMDRARVAARDGGECPASFASWAAQIFGPIPAHAPGPLAPKGEGRPADDAAALVGLVSESASLFEEPELARWRPRDEALRSFALKVEEAESSPLYLEGAEGALQREEAIGAVVDREAAAYFDDRQRGLFAAFLLDTARLFELTGRSRQAQVAAATARMLASGAAVERIPFCGQLFARLFARPATGGPPRPAERRGPEGEAPSLIIRPDEF